MGDTANFPSDLLTLMQEKNFNGIVDRIKELDQNRAVINNSLWEILISESKDWEEKANIICRSNPSRDLKIRDNVSDKAEERLIYYLLKNGLLQQAQWLINNGDNVNTLQNVFSNAEIPYSILISTLLSSHISKMPNREKITDFLIENNADVNLLVSSKPTLWHLLKQSLSLNEAAYLIAKGANVNITYGDDSRSLLLDILMNTELEKLESHANFLIQMGADVNARTSNGRLILTTLLIEGKFYSAKILADRGGKIDPNGLKLKSNFGKDLKTLVKSSPCDSIRAFVDMTSHYHLRDLFLNDKLNEALEWIKHHPKDIFAKFGAEGCSLLYLLLIAKKFDAAMMVIKMASPNDVPKLLNSYDFNSYDSRKIPLIYTLLFEEHFEAAKFLIEMGANLMTRVNENAIFIELLLNKKDKAAEFLLKTACDKKLYITDDLKEKILNGRFDEAREEVTSYLMKRPTTNTHMVNVMLSDEWKIEAPLTLRINPSLNIDILRTNTYIKLLYAMIRLGHFDRAQWLIDHGAEVDALQNIFNGNTFGSSMLFSLFLDVNILEENRKKSLDFLIKNGSNPNQFFNSLPLLAHILVQPNGLINGEYLIAHGADVNVMLPSGWTLLLYLLFSIKEELIEIYANFLINQGADVNKRSATGFFMLTDLLLNEKMVAANYIAQKGAVIDPEDLQFKTITGRTIEQLIKAEGNEEGNESLSRLLL
jgi:ankyrin repeat protein